MLNQFSRTELIIGEKAIQKLHKSKVAVFGIGGVGSFVVEGLVRAGIEKFILVDHDKISLTNLNRQVIANRNNIGEYKVEVAKQRILSINPNVDVQIIKEFFMPNSKIILDNSIDYIIDCMDIVTAKIELIMRAKSLNIPVISCMGTGNKIDPTKFEITDIYKTSICPLAKIMRKELRARKIKDLKVIYSKEEPIKHFINDNEVYINDDIYSFETKEQSVRKKQVPGSISFVPSVAGLIIAGEVIKDI